MYLPTYFIESAVFDLGTNVNKNIKIASIIAFD